MSTTSFNKTEAVFEPTMEEAVKRPASTALHTRALLPSSHFPAVPALGKCSGQDCVPGGESWHWLMHGHRCSPLCPLVASGRAFSRQKAACTPGRLQLGLHVFTASDSHGKAGKLAQHSQPCVEEIHPYQKRATGRRLPSTVLHLLAEWSLPFKLLLAQNSRLSCQTKPGRS